jgi:hypothetical protein
MGDLRLPLTDRNVSALPLAPTAQYLARDTELRGFFVLVGIRAKELHVTGRPARPRRVAVDPHEGRRGWGAQHARAKAKAVLAAIANGEDPREARTGD